MFKVSRNVLMQHSPAFNYELSKNPTQRCFDIAFDSLLSIEVCLRALHNTLSEEMYTVPIEEVWKTIQFCNFCRIEFSKLNSWFNMWYHVKLRNTPKEMEIDEMRQLLFPCYIFDHAWRFASLTQGLAYRVPDHITEKNPTKYRSLHLDGNVIGIHPLLKPISYTSNVRNRFTQCNPRQS